MRILFYSFAVLAIFSSCVKNNPDPAWIEVKEWTLEENVEAVPGIAGTLTHNFSDAWVYVDGDLLGVFEVPFKIPVLKEGTVNIQLLPTIRDNGISATKKAYPFVEAYMETVSLEKNKTTTINPKTRYKKSTSFWIEDFEDPAVKIEENPNNTAHLLIDDSSPVPQWGACGKISLSSSANSFLAYTNQALFLSKGYEVYLEVDYYNTTSLTTGLLSTSLDGSSKDNPAITMNAQDASAVKWKKIYIAMKELVGGSPNNASFKVSLSAYLTENATGGDIYIDNIKIVY